MKEFQHKELQAHLHRHIAKVGLEMEARPPDLRVCMLVHYTEEEKEPCSGSSALQERG